MPRGLTKSKMRSSALGSEEAAPFVKCIDEARFWLAATGAERMRRRTEPGPVDVQLGVAVPSANRLTVRQSDRVSGRERTGR